MGPGRLFLVVFSLVAWCLLAAHFIYAILNTPFIGAKFSADIDGNAIVVESVNADGPADKSGLLKGDRVIGITSLKTGESYQITGFEAIAGRHQLHSHEMSSAAGDAMKNSWRIISNGPFELELENSERLTIKPERSRNLWNLPTTSIPTLFESLGVILISLGIFAFAHRSPAVNFLTIGGVGLSMVALTNSVTGARELVIPVELLAIIHPINALGSILFSYGLLSVLWHYPRRISKYPVELLLFGLGLITFISSYTQWFELPIHTYQIPNLLPFPIAILFSVIQWRRTSNNPLERASVLWFMLSIYGTTSFVVLLYSIPILFQLPPVLGPHTSTAILTLTYFGIAFGTLRVRLFDVHWLWWRAILWLAGGVFVFIADILLVTLLDLWQAQALPIALFLAGWLYFPARQWVLRYFVDSQEVKIADHIPDMINTFSDLSEPELFNGRYVSFMKRIFNATDIGQRREKSTTEPKLMNNGLSLEVANLSGDGTFELIGRSGGNRLFSTKDVETSKIFATLVRQMFDARMQEFNNLDEERKRIIRDLHDDVGGRLLSLIYNSKEKRVQNEARATLKALKESLVVIENREAVDFSVFWASVVEEATLRTSEAKLKLNVNTELKIDRVMSVRETVNLKRIVQEIITNGIKYNSRGGQTLSVSLSDDGLITLRSENHYDKKQPIVEQGNRGLANMKRRISDIGGSINIETAIINKDEGKFVIEAKIPNSDEMA